MPQSLVAFVSFPSAHPPPPHQCLLKFQAVSEIATVYLSLHSKLSLALKLVKTHH